MGIGLSHASCLQSSEQTLYDSVDTSNIQPFQIPPDTNKAVQYFGCCKWRGIDDSYLQANRFYVSPYYPVASFASKLFDSFLEV